MKDQYEVLCDNLEVVFKELQLSEMIIKYCHSQHMNLQETKTIYSKIPSSIKIKYGSKSYMDRYNKFLELIIELKKYNIHISLENTIYPPNFNSRDYFEVYINIEQSLNQKETEE